MVTIYNKRYNDAPINAVYVGRPSKWGNKWSHLPGKTLAEFKVDSIQEAVNKHLMWLYTIFKDIDLFDKYVEGLEGKDLVCWCAPKGGIDVNSDDHSFKCHAIILARLADVHFTCKDHLDEFTKRTDLINENLQD